MDSSNGMSQGQDTAVSSPGLTQATGGAPQATPSHPEERVFKQNDVNEIVKRAKLDAVEGYKRLQSEQPNYAQQKYGDAGQPPNNPTSQSQSSTESEIRRVAAEEAQRLRDQWTQDARSKAEAEYAQRTVQNFWNKLAPGKEKYQDFDTVTGDIEFARFPNVVQLLAEHVDNAHDVLYELGNDRIKMSNLEQLANTSPKDAIVQMRRLSQSLKDNEEARKTKIPNEPLSQITPTNTGTDNGVMSVRDFRRKYRC